MQLKPRGRLRRHVGKDTDQVGMLVQCVPESTKNNSVTAIIKRIQKWRLVSRLKVSAETPI